MAAGGFVYEIEVTREGEPVRVVPASVAACLEDGLFGAVISGRVANDGAVPPHALTPVWDAGGAPAVAALELRLGDAPARRYDAAVIAPQARACLAALLEEHAIEADDKVTWRLVAREKSVGAGRFAARVSRAPWPLRAERLREGGAGELGIEIDRSVLTGLSADVAAADAIESAWLLAGTLCHDAERGTAALRVHASVGVEVGRGGASQHHFAFEPAAFVAARRAAAAQIGGMIPIGWAHSHPPCADCRSNAGCRVDTRFFSADDVEVHASAFTSPYMVGLVVGKVADQSATRPGFRLYGWRRAQVQERTYSVRENT